MDFEEKHGKISDCRTFIVLRPCPAAGRLVTSLQERRRLLQFALQFSFAALHGKQPRPLFRAQAPLHGQETSTVPWSYLTRMVNFNKKRNDV